MFNKKRAFSLAEVLIAMTIVGVVSALTVPQLMSNTTARSNRLKVQKAYANLANAFAIGESKYDFNTADLDDSQEFNLQSFLTKSMNVVRTSMTSYPFSGKLITGDEDGSVSVASSFAASGITSSAQVYKTKDGVYYVFPPFETRTNADGFENIGCTKSTPCVGYIDINGPEAPNELITCTSGSDGNPYYDLTNKMWVHPDECVVDASAITDIYPFIFFDAEIMPAVNAFDAVLTTEVKK